MNGLRKLPISNSGNQGIATGRAKNLTQESGISTSNPNAGRHSICYGRDDVLYLLIRDSADHDFSAGKAILKYSVDECRNWIDIGDFYVPTAPFDGVQSLNIMYDFPSNRYIITIEQSNTSTQESEIRIFYTNSNPEDLADSSEWNESTITDGQPFGFTNKITFPPIRRGKDNIVMTVYGKETSGGAANPAVYKSGNNGSNWALVKNLTTVAGGEASYYWKQNIPIGQVDNYLMVRSNNEGERAQIVRANNLVFSSTKTYSTELSIAGGALVVPVNGYYMMIWRNVLGSADSMGMISYSIDGLAYTEGEPLRDVIYPVQPQVTFNSQNKMLLSGWSQPSGRSDLGFIWMMDYNPPTYEEILAKCKNLTLTIIDPNTTVAAGNSIETQWFDLYSDSAKLLVRDQGGTGETLENSAVLARYFTDKLGDSASILIKLNLNQGSNENIPLPQQLYGDVPILARYVQFEFVNGEVGSRKISMSLTR